MSRPNRCRKDSRALSDYANVLLGLPDSARVWDAPLAIIVYSGALFLPVNIHERYIWSRLLLQSCIPSLLDSQVCHLLCLHRSDPMSCRNLGFNIVYIIKWLGFFFLKYILSFHSIHSNDQKLFSLNSPLLYLLAICT